MFFEIFRRETLDSAASGKLLSIGVLCCALIPLSVAVNHGTVSDSIAQMERARAEYERSLEGSAATDSIEVQAFRPRPVLASLATGLDDGLPNVVRISQLGMSLGQAQMIANPVSRLFGAITLLFIVRIILSLVAVSVSYNLICGEKELGTLRLVLTNPVPRDSVLTAKIASACAVLVVPFTVGTLASLVLIQVTGGRAFGTPEQWVRVGLIYLASVLYLGVFVNLGALVSTLTSRSMAAMMSLLALWVLAVAVIPQTAGLIAEVLHPVESPEAFMLRKSLAEDDLDHERAAEQRGYADREDFSSIRDSLSQKYSARLQQLHSRMDEDYARERRAQGRIATTLATVSPASSLTFATTALAGTGVLQAEHFGSRLSQFRQRVNQELFANNYRDYFMNSPLAAGVPLVSQVSIVQLKDLPVFEYQPPRLPEVVDAIWPHLLLLALFNVLFFLAAYLRFRRYDTR